MGVFSGLGSIFHGIGHTLESLIGDDNNDPRKRQDQAQQPASVRVAQRPQTNSVVQDQPDLNNMLHLQPLQKANPNPQPAPTTPAPQPPQPAPQQHTQPPLASTLLKAATPDVVKSAAGAGYGASKFGLDSLRGALHIPALISGAANWLTQGLGNSDALKGANEAVQKATTGADQKISFDKLNMAGDKLTKAIGPQAQSASELENTALNVGATIDGGLGLLKGGRTLLNKASGASKPVDELAVEGTEAAGQTPRTEPDLPTTSEPNPVSPITVAPDEVVPGVKSANPNQVVDAAQQAAQRAASNTVELPPQVAKTANAAPVAPTEPTVLGQPTQPTEAPIAPATPETVPQTPVAPTPQVVPTQADVAKAVAEGQPLSVPVDANGNPVMSQAQAAEAAGVAPAPAMPDLPPSELTAENAPRQRAAILKQLTGVGRDLPKDGQVHDVTNIEQLTNAAQSNIAAMSDNDLVNAFTGSLSNLPSDENGIAVLRAAIGRLDKLDPEKNPEAVDALENALDEYQNRSSKSGLIQRYVQEDFDTMPKAMKVRYIIRQIDKANSDIKGYIPLADDPAKADAVEQAITNFLTSGEQINDRIATLQGQLNEVMAASKEGVASDADIRAISQQLQQAKGALRANNADILKVYQDSTPKGPVGARAAQAQKSMMLASFGGRVADILNTSANIGHLSLENITRGLLAKAVNLIKPGAAVDTSKGAGTFIRGTFGGAKSGVSGVLTNRREAGDLVKAIKGTSMDRGDLRAPRSAAGNVVHNAVNLPENLSKGVHDQHLIQLADQEAQQLNIPKEYRQQYVEARAAHPTPHMEHRAAELRDSVNNMEDNPISRFFASIANAPSAAFRLTGRELSSTSKLSGAGKVAGNLYLPFTRVLGGMTWSALTDKNVVANAVNFARAAKNGDVDGMVANLAKGVNNTAYMVGFGYGLSKLGVISNKDPEGYSDQGAYINLGGHSVPVSMLGFFAPGIIVGNAYYNAVNSDEGSAPSHFLKTAEASITGGLKAFGGMQALGADNPVVRTLTAIQAQGSKVGPLDLAAQEAGQAVGEFIPGITRDINAGLDYTGLNSNHEKPETVVHNTDPLTGKPSNKNYAASAVTSVLSKIPIASQLLPRKEGVAANSLVDRATRGSSISDTQAEAIAQGKTDANLAVNDKQNGVPDPTKSTKGYSFDEAVKQRIETGKFDQAIEGLKQKVDILKRNPDEAPSDIEDVKNRVTQLGVAKDNQLSFDDMKLYNSTTLSEWRDMGDPQSDTYDSAAYQKLWNIDAALAKQSVAGTFKGIGDGSTAKMTGDKQKYSAKTAGKGKGGSGGSKSNTIGSLTELKKIDFGNLAPSKINTQIPSIDKIAPSQLIKKRTISVSKAK